MGKAAENQAHCQPGRFWLLTPGFSKKSLIWKVEGAWEASRFNFDSSTRRVFLPYHLIPAIVASMQSLSTLLWFTCDRSNICKLGERGCIEKGGITRSAEACSWNR